MVTIKDGERDRSEDTYRVLGACMDAGLSLVAAELVILTDPKLAERHRQKPDRLAEEWVKLDADRQARRWNTEGIILPASAPRTAADTVPGAATPGRRLTITERALSRAELDRLPEPEALIADTLDRRTVALLAGPFGTCKSFLALDWALSIATGRMWQRREIATPGRVLYIASEGAYGYVNRVRAWEAGWNRREPVESLTVVPFPVNLRRPDEVAELCELAKGCALVVADTLARCLVGADENSAQDMGEAVDSAYRLAEATRGGTVLLVHHTGKDNETTRGSSALESGVDTVYKTKGDARLIEVTRTKRKEGPTDDRLTLRLSGVPDTGSCVLTSPKVSETASDIRGKARELYDTFRRHFSATGCSQAELRRVANWPPATFAESVNMLVESEWLHKEGSRQRTWFTLGTKGPVV